jgi:hypothetical protein
MLPPADGAFAWGASGHRMIGETASRLLPLEIPEFLRDAEASRQIGEVAREPDRSRGAGEPHDNDLNPAHHIDAGDDLKIARGPELSALPPTRERYDTALRAMGTNQYRAGYLPYAIVDAWQQLVVDLGTWRADVAGAKWAKSPAEQTWFLKDRYLREGLTIRDLGYLAHFVGDGGQPLHVTLHSDGWGNYPNLQRFSTERGLHARFEGAFVAKWIKEGDVAAHVAPYRDCGCTIQQQVADYLSASQRQVVTLYELEKAGGFDGTNEAGKMFAAMRLAASVSELRDMIVDAWRQSGEISVGYPPIAVKDIESGAVEGLNSLQGVD